MPIIRKQSKNDRFNHGLRYIVEVSFFCAMNLCGEDNDSNIGNENTAIAAV
jgi:hypothetical protein